MVLLKKMKEIENILEELKGIRELCKWASSRDIGETIEMLIEKYENCDADSKSIN